MTSRGHRDAEIWQYFKRLSSGGDFGLDPRGSEQQVKDDPDLVLAMGDQAHGGETPSRFLFDDGVDAVATLLEGSYDPLGVGVARDGDRQIDVPGKAWLGSGRDGQRPDERPLMTEVGEVGAGAAESGLEPAQGLDCGQAASSLPGASPISAPGRVRSHVAR